MRARALPRLAAVRNHLEAVASRPLVRRAGEGCSPYFQPAQRRRRRAPQVSRWLLIAFLMLAFAGQRAYAQQVSVSVESRQIYAGLPFVLSVTAEGFDEEPQPQVADFQISGCTVSFLGVSPSVATSISIVNGQRTESRRVEFTYRYRVTAPAPGEYQVPALTVTQGNKTATTRPGKFRATDLATTPDMQIRLTLPERPVTVGETFDVTLDWYLAKDPGNQSFSVPLFDADWVDLRVPAAAAPGPGRRRQVLSFPAGDREVELPYTSERAMLDGRQYTRFRFTATVTPIQPGTFQIEPTRVVAEVQAGMGRDAFGFPAPRMQLFKAEDVARTLEVKPLPMTNRPPSFANAVGTGFSIQVQASRTVVKVGDPVELEITIRGDARLEGLSLPPLDNPEGLPADKFVVSDAQAAGEIVDLPGGGKAKRFRVTVRLSSADVREIPPIAFSYYNPKSGQYETARSQPIALSVEGSSMVGAGDVVSAVKTPQGPAAGGAEPGQTAEIGSYVGADLSLSAADAALARPLGVGEIRPFLYVLYLVPLLVLGVRAWQVRTRARRDRSSEAKTAWRAVDKELERAAKDPAREVAPALLAALRALAAATGQSPRGHAVIERIETEAYAPKAVSTPLAQELVAEARKLAQGWLQAERARRLGTPGSSAAAALLVPWLLTSLGGVAQAQAPAQEQTQAQAQEQAQAPAPAQVQAQAGNQAAAAAPAAPAAVTIDSARAAYQAALAESDRSARTRAFARAELLFRQLVDTYPDRPELLTDWGNAALGAQDIGRAILAYRRALAADAGAARAERNLAWARERQPSWLPRPEVQRAQDSLFFWHHLLSVPTQHLVAAVAFALVVLLVAPWGRRQRLLRRLAVAPALVWIAMVASIIAAEPPVNDAVIIGDSVPLLSADSPGAPAALQNPLPPGAEVTIIEMRGAWARVALANGAKGWVQTSAVARVVPR